MEILIIISFLAILLYTTAVCIKNKGIPNSISATFYSLKHKLWFGATMFTTAGALMPAILEISKSNSEWAAFLACFGMALVGVAPNFKEKFEGHIHTAGAILCLVFSQVWVTFNQPWLLIVWSIYAIVASIKTFINYKRSKNIKIAFIQTKPMFWVEIVALATTYMAILSKYLFV